jgi:hypothetical protein
MTTIYRVIAEDGTERMATSPRQLTLLSSKAAGRKYRKRPFKGPVVYRLQGFRDWCYSCTSRLTVYQATKVQAKGHDPGSVEAAVSYLGNKF